MVDPEILIKSSSGAPGVGVNAAISVHSSGGSGNNNSISVTSASAAAAAAAAATSSEMLAVAVGNFLRIPRPFQYPFFHPHYNQYIYGQAATSPTANNVGATAAHLQQRKNGLENHVFNPKIIIQDQKDLRNASSQLKG